MAVYALENITCRRDPTGRPLIHIGKTRVLTFWRNLLPQLTFGTYVEYDLSNLCVVKIIRRINRIFAISEFCGDLAFARRGFVPRGEHRVAVKCPSPLLIPVQLFDLIFGEKFFSRKLHKSLEAIK